MGKVIGIGALVLGLWCAVEVYNNGAANAFGGALTKIGLADEAPETATPTTAGARAGSAANRAHQDADDRRNRLLGE
jgi:hypothetical protein